MTNERIDVDLAYEKAMYITTDLLSDIKKALHNHIDKAGENVNWGHVGEINQANSELCKVLDFFNNRG